MPSNGIVSYYTLVRTGSRDEYEVGKTGFAHFFEHMMFRGTKKYPGTVYDSLIISIGADGNAYTTDDYTAYHLNLANEDLDLVMELESDRFQNLSYPEPDFKTESGAVYGEYRKNITDPGNVIWEKLKFTAFDKHTYKHSTIGFEEDIKAMPTLYEYSKEF
ncbi:MAG: insulinase family protein, partial [Candidatus Kapaibacterium sp.]